jgi:hypothetical protein
MSSVGQQDARSRRAVWGRHPTKHTFPAAALRGVRDTATSEASEHPVREQALLDEMFRTLEGQTSSLQKYLHYETVNGSARRRPFGLLCVAFPARRSVFSSPTVQRTQTSSGNIVALALGSRTKINRKQRSGLGDFSDKKSESRNCSVRNLATSFAGTTCPRRKVMASDVLVHTRYRQGKPLVTRSRSRRPVASRHLAGKPTIFQVKPNTNDSVLAC